MPYKQSTPLTAEAVKQFADTFAEEQMAALHVPGAAVVVVQGDSILYQQGYGWAEIASQTAVNPAQTVFRAGSVSKLFTATAVMQLVEQGKIDLDSLLTRTYPLSRINEAYEALECGEVARSLVMPQEG